MRTAIKKTVVGAVGVIATVGLLTACGRSDKPTAVKAPEASTSPMSTAESSPADPTKTELLLVDTADYPAGYKAQTFPREQMKAAVKQLLATARDAKTTPAKCVQLSVLPTDADLDRVALRLAMKDATSLSQAITVSPFELADFRNAASGDCEKVSIEMEVMGQKADATVTQKVIDGPTTKAPDTVVVEMATTSSSTGATVTSKALMGYAKVNGYIVGVQFQDMLGTGELDRAAFDKLFVAAVNKVVNES